MKNGENNVTTISKKQNAEFVSATVNSFPPELAEKSKYYYYKLSFFLAAAIAILLLLPVTISGDGYFLYYGDYNVQQIPFYQHAVEMVRSGSINWDWGTDLGSGFLNNYAFYLSGSPFFWITCLFPSSLTPYLMAPMYVLKFATASFCAFLFLRRFVKKPGSALIGAL
ncbi:MAG: YfhO family protein, partial [Clostridia bacterium]|nr:YfhO family protein [Clostridia bacterium]